MASRSPSGIHWLRATWIHLVCTIYRFLPLARKVHPPSKPMTGLNPHLTNKLEENLVFDASALNVPFFSAHMFSGVSNSRTPELPKDPEISPCSSILRAFRLTLKTVFQISGVSKSRNLSTWLQPLGLLDLTVTGDPETSLDIRFSLLCKFGIGEFDAITSLFS
jgi:hypothetical protein